MTTETPSNFADEWKVGSFAQGSCHCSLEYVSDFILTDEWKVGLYDKQGQCCCTGQYVAGSAVRDYFNTDVLRDGETLTMTSNNYAAMTGGVRCPLLFIDGRVSIPGEELKKNEDNYKLRISPTRVIDVGPMNLMMWLTSRKITPIVTSDKKCK